MEIPKIVSARTQVAKSIWPFQGYGLLLLIVLSFFPRLFHLEEYLFFTLLALAVLARWWEGQTIWVRTPIDRPLWFFIGWVLITIPFAQDPTYSFSEWRKLVAQALVFYWAMAFWQSLSKDQCARWLLAFFQALLVGTVCSMMIALAQYFLSGGDILPRDGFRADAPFSSSPWLATYAIMTFPFLFFGYLSQGCIKTKLSRLAGAVLALAGLFYSWSRAGMLALFAESIVAAYFRNIVTRQWFAIYSLLGGLGILLIVGVSWGRGQHLLDRVYERWEFWQYGWALVVQHPIMGVGYGNDTIARTIMDTASVQPIKHLHNSLLVLAVGSGLPALVLFLCALWRIFFSLSKTRNISSHSLLSAIRTAGAVMIVGVVVRNLFDYMLAGSLAYLFWMLLAPGLAYHEVEDTERKSTVS